MYISSWIIILQKVRIIRNLSLLSPSPSDDNPSIQPTVLVTPRFDLDV